MIIKYTQAIFLGSLSHDPRSPSGLIDRKKKLKECERTNYMMVHAAANVGPSQHVCGFGDCVDR